MLVALLVAHTATGADLLRVREAWIQEGPPTVPVLAGYLTVQNTSGREVRLVGVTSEIAERVEIHRTEFSDTTATMRRMTQLTLPPGATLAFTADGYHLMLFGVEKPPVAGAKITLELELASGEIVKTLAEVRRSPEAP